MTQTARVESVRVRPCSPDALPLYPKYQFKATIEGEVAPGFTLQGSFALHSGGSTIVPLGASTTKTITQQETWLGEMFGKVHVGKPKNKNEESLIANWPIDELQVRMAAMIHVQKGEGWNLGGVFDIQFKAEKPDFVLSGTIQVPFAYNGCELPEPENLDGYVVVSNATGWNATEYYEQMDEEESRGPVDPSPQSCAVESGRYCPPRHRNALRIIVS